MLPPQRIPLTALAAMPAFTEGEMAQIRAATARLAAPCLADFQQDLVLDGEFLLGAYGCGGAVHVFIDAPAMRLLRSMEPIGTDMARRFIIPILEDLPWDRLRDQAARFPEGALPRFNLPLLRGWALEGPLQLIREAWVRMMLLQLDGSPEATRYAKTVLTGEVRDLLREDPTLLSEYYPSDKAICNDQVTLEEMAAAIRPGCPREMVEILCRAVARHGGTPAERSRMVRAAGVRSGIGARAALAMLRNEERILDSWIQTQFRARLVQRVREALPDYPGSDLRLPWCYRILPDGRISRRFATGWDDILLAPVIPDRIVIDPRSGRWSLAVWVRPEPARWRCVEAGCEHWLHSVRLRRLLREVFGASPLTRRGAVPVATYMADMEAVLADQSPRFEPVFGS